MLKKKVLHEISVYFHKKTFSQAYLIWAPKLDVLKIGIPLFKSTLNTPVVHFIIKKFLIKN